MRNLLSKYSDHNFRSLGAVMSYHETSLERFFIIDISDMDSENVSRRDLGSRVKNSEEQEVVGDRNVD